MPRRAISWRPSLPVAAAMLAALAMLAGALLWFRPFLTHQQTFPAGVPTPVSLSAPAPFTVAAGEQACMSSITIEPGSRVAQFSVQPAAPARTGPPVELLLEAAGYRSSGTVPGGYQAGVVSASVTPPRRSVVGTACFLDRGPGTITLLGTIEPRTVTRSGTTIAGTPVVGDIALTFLRGRPSSLLDSIGSVFAHASSLTDHLLPVWLIWLIAVLVALGVPAGALGAFYLALREDETSGAL
jgi:hypothetical protein